MKAAVFNTYGGPEVVHVQDNLAVPAVAAGQVLVRVQAVGVNPRDAVARSGRFKWMMSRKFPKITGADFAGTVEQVGPGVLGFQPGDAVFGYWQDFSGGTAAEYIAVPTKWLALKPQAIPAAVAAALPCAYLTALQALRDKARLQPGQRVLVYGASGGVGTAAIQLARYFGAHVTAVSSRRNAAYCRAAGAHEVLAYDEVDVFSQPEPYDVFFQVYAKETALYAKARAILRPRGVFITLIPSPLLIAQGWLYRLLPRPRLVAMLVQAKPADLRLLADLTLQGHLQPHLHTELPLEQAAEAHRLIDTGHTVGKIVLTVS